MSRSLEQAPVQDALLWIKSHLKFLAVRLTAIAVRWIPFRYRLIETAGLLLGLAAMVLNIGRWKNISAFARHCGSSIPSWRYVPRFYIQWARDRVWCEIYYEETPVLGKYFTLEGTEEINKAREEGRGMIFVGAHYGPPLYRYLLEGIGIETRQLVGTGIDRKMLDDTKFGVDFLTSRRARLYREIENNLVAKRSEKDFIRFLKNGGGIILFIEVPRKDDVGVAVDFLGYKPRISDFPFKLSLRYKAPVFFCHLENSKSGGYRLVAAPLKGFATPEEGVRRYAECLETQILKNPFPWINVPNFMNWFRGR